MCFRILLSGIFATAAIIGLRPQDAFAQPSHCDSGVAADKDCDGIKDSTETSLLARFTPYVRFSNDRGVEQYRPMDAWNYVRWSELQTDGDEGKGVIVVNSILLNNPAAVLGKGTDLMTDKRFREDRFLNPLKDVPRKGGNWARYGYEWRDVLAKRNVGFYGHVVRFDVRQPQTDFLQCTRSKTPSNTNRDFVLCDLDVDQKKPKSYYKIEYWQFFGYNGVGKPFDFGDHEGDWTTVQVIVDVTTLEPVQVHHFAHGYRFGFDMQAGRLRSTVDLNGGLVREYRGMYWSLPVEFWWHDTSQARANNVRSALSSQNNVLRMRRDATTGKYDHPVVYVEHGGHEFWPTEAWGFQDSPNHNGDDVEHSYLAAAPPNLGEVEYPLAEVPEATIVLRFNGRWGAYSRRNASPQGPALHNGWTWPSSSSIRWQLPKDLGN